MYVSELSGLKEQLTSRDRAVIELNNELECVRQQITQLNNNYQNALQQCQLAQLSLYVYVLTTDLLLFSVLTNGNSCSKSFMFSAFRAVDISCASQ